MAEPARGRWRALFFLSLAELGALSLWFSAAAVLPALSREWHLGDGGRAGLTIAVQAGFILGTLGSALGNLPDVMSPRILMLWSAVAGAALNGALALWVESLGPALASVLRDLMSEARDALAATRRMTANLPRAQRVAVLPVALVEPYLRALEKAERNPFHDLAELSPLARIWPLFWSHLSGRL